MRTTSGLPLQAILHPKRTPAVPQCSTVQYPAPGSLQMETKRSGPAQSLPSDFLPAMEALRPSLSSGVALSASATASPGWRSGPHWLRAALNPRITPLSPFHGANRMVCHRVLWAWADVHVGVWGVPPKKMGTDLHFVSRFFVLNYFCMSRFLHRDFWGRAALRSEARCAPDHPHANPTWRRATFACEQRGAAAATVALGAGRPAGRRGTARAGARPPPAGPAPAAAAAPAASARCGIGHHDTQEQAGGGVWGFGIFEIF